MKRASSAPVDPTDGPTPSIPDAKITGLMSSLKVIRKFKSKVKNTRKAKEEAEEAESHEPMVELSIESAKVMTHLLTFLTASSNAGVFTGRGDYSEQIKLGDMIKEGRMPSQDNRIDLSSLSILSISYAVLKVHTLWRFQRDPYFLIFRIILGPE